MGLLDRLRGRKELSSEAPAVQEYEYGPGADPLLLGAGLPRTSDATQLAAVEAATGLIARSLGMAEVSGPLTGSLGPLQLQEIARDLVSHGEALFLLDSESDGRLSLVPVACWDVMGASTSPLQWRYRVNIASPDRQTTRELAGEEVLHFRFNPSRSQPWKGRSPLALASATAGLALAVTASLHTDARFARRQLAIVKSALPDGQRQAIERALNQGPETQWNELAQSWTLLDSPGGHTLDGGSGSGWEFRTLGSSPEMSQIELFEKLESAMYAVCGVPGSLLRGQGSAGGQREGARQLAFSVINPMKRLIEQEADMKLGAGRKTILDMSALHAADLTGRARALAGMVRSGATLDSAAKAAAIEGLIDAEDMVPRDTQPIGDSGPGAM